MVGFSHQRYTEVFNETFAKVAELSKLKGGEYAGDNDRLANFRRNGVALGLPLEAVWAVYAAKHWDAILQSVNDTIACRNRERMEPLEGRVNDLITYLVLFKCALEERRRAGQTRVGVVDEK